MSAGSEGPRENAAPGVILSSSYSPNALPFFLRERVMHQKFKRELDPLDLEILERAFESAWAAFKEKAGYADLDSDKELEAALRRELIDIVRCNGGKDAETLRDILLATWPDA